MKKKLIGLLGISVLVAASFLNMPAYAITTSAAQAACSALGGQFNVSSMNNSGEATWSCSAPKTGTVGGSESTDTYKTACETLGGTFTVTANGSNKTWNCSGFNAKVYGTSDGNPPSTTTTTGAAYQYITARDNSQVVAKAKNRIVQIVLGLVIWVMIWAVLEFLLPGGLFANGQ